MTDTLLDVEPAGRKLPDSSQAKALRDALRHHYLKPGESYPGGVYLTEVRAPGEGGTVRLADAVFVGYNTVATRAIEVCEIKTSRADLMREIDSPAKTAAWWPYCSRFWIVSPSPAVTPPELLPDGWGLMCPKRNGRRFQVHREASERTPMVDFDLLMVLAKKIEMSHGSDVSHARAAGRAAAEAEHRADRNRWWQENPRLPADSQEKLDALRKVEEATGFRLVGDEWNAYGRRVTTDGFAAAMQLALTGVVGNSRAALDLGNLLRKLTEVQDAIGKAAARVKEAHNAHTRITAAPPAGVESAAAGCVCKLAGEVIG